MSPSPPTWLAGRFVQYVAGFGVSVGVGLAPLLGRLDVPLFEPLLRLYPPGLQNTLIPLSSFLMGVIALALQFYAGYRQTKTWRRRMFTRVLWGLVLAFLLLCCGYFFLVVTIPVPAVDDSASFVIGYARAETCPCPPELSDAECIKALSFDPSRIQTCWGDSRVRASHLLLSLLYLLVMGGFASLIALLLLGDGPPADR